MKKIEQIQSPKIRWKTILTVGVLAAAMMFSTMMFGTVASAYGPSTLYTPSSSAPAPGSLYARAIQLSSQTTSSNNGKMYATFEQYTSGTPVFPIYESKDNGSSWSLVGNVSDTHRGYGMRYQPQLFELTQAIGTLSKGTLICAGNSIPSTLASTNIDLYYSTNFGRSWTYLSTVATGGYADPSGSYDPVWEPFLLIYNNQIVCFYSDETDSSYSQKIVHKTSSDGVTWSSAVNDVALSTSTYRPGMPTIAKLSDGTYVMTYEIVNYASTNPIFYKTSTNPLSWNASSKGTQIAGGRGTPYVSVMSDGKLVVSDWNTANLYVNSNGVSGTWSKVSCTLSSGYSRCLVPLSNGRLFVIRGNTNTTSSGGVIYGDQVQP